MKPTMAVWKQVSYEWWNWVESGGGHWTLSMQNSGWRIDIDVTVTAPSQHPHTAINASITLLGQFAPHIIPFNTLSRQTCCREPIYCLRHFNHIWGEDGVEILLCYPCLWKSFMLPMSLEILNIWKPFLRKSCLTSFRFKENYNSAMQVHCFLL